MARVKSITTKKHKKIRKATKGYRQARRRRIKAGKEAILHAGQYAYIGRKQRKRNLRRLWIIRLNAALRELGQTYSKFIKNLREKNILLDRKILSEIAVKYPEDFKKIVDKTTK
jgi:large subunit ribosomal protein L20